MVDLEICAGFEVLLLEISTEDYICFLIECFVCVGGLRSWGLIEEFSVFCDFVEHVGFCFVEFLLNSNKIYKSVKDKPGVFVFTLHICDLALNLLF